jgi:uncharacterized protein YrrD
MQFKQGANVYTSDGRDVGRIDRVVLDPKTKEVTHIVVRKGFLFTEDKIVSLSLIASALEDKVTLRPDAGNLDALLPFEETHYIPADEAETKAAQYSADLASPLYWYPPVGGWMGYGADYAYAYPPPYVVETEQHIPKGTVALQEGSIVTSADGKHVGNVERILSDSTSDRATYFLISQGFLFKEKKRIPVTWIRQIKENEVQLSVNAHTLEGLHEYQEM